jgi:hypothetical protein
VAEHAITQPEDLAAKTLDELKRRFLLSSKAAAD